jgi:hypothetical protein
MVFSGIGPDPVYSPWYYLWLNSEEWPRPGPILYGKIPSGKVDLISVRMAPAGLINAIGQTLYSMQWEAVGESDVSRSPNMYKRPLDP